MALAIGEPLELSSGSLGLKTRRVEERHIAFAVDDDDRAVLAANQLDQIGHEAKRRLADAGAAKNMEVLEQKLQVDEDRVVVGQCPRDDDGVPFLDISAFEKPVAVAI